MVFFEEVAAFRLSPHQIPRCSVGEAGNGCPQSRLFVVVSAQSVNNVDVVSDSCLEVPGHSRADVNHFISDMFLTAFGDTEEP